MTVKSLSDTQKDSIEYLFMNRIRTIDELAEMYQRSRRTIIRVLEETGVDPGIKRRKPKPKAQPVTSLVALPTTPKPWWQRALAKVPRWPFAINANSSNR